MSVRIERLIRIYNRLRRGPVTIEIISKWAKGAGIQVSDRQLYRDLNELKSLRIAEGENVLEFSDEKNRKTWKLEYDEDGEKISQFDLNSFFLLKNFSPYAIYEHRKSSIEKFEKIIYKNLSKNRYQQVIEANELYMRRTNYFENMYGEIEHKKIEDLLWALQNKKRIQVIGDLLNCSNIPLSEKAFPFAFYPLELVFHGGRLHLGGLSAEKGEFMLFAIDKGFLFQLTNETFNRKKLTDTYKEEFDKLFGIGSGKNKRVYNVKIEFTESYGNSAKNFFFHHSQKWSTLPNGNYLLELRCTLGRELFGFLGLSLDKVKVHQPKLLKDLFIKKMNQIRLIHEEDRELSEETANADY
jgi:predicted DNA-binding transcriptional regulator YafY